MGLVSMLPKNITRICLDLDDVLVDFEGALENLWFGHPLEDIEKQGTFWKGITVNEEMRDKMWYLINKGGADWWANLKKLPWADALWEAANKACDDVIILSSPGDSIAAEVAAQGKVRWSIEEFGHNVLCLTSRKYMCACEDVVLIDDLDKFIEPWDKNGGVAIKLRKRWESNSIGTLPYDIVNALNKYAEK